jgi:hypothetical protein
MFLNLFRILFLLGHGPEILDLYKKIHEQCSYDTVSWRTSL